jgi:hypothetical protein
MRAGLPAPKKLRRIQNPFLTFQPFSSTKKNKKKQHHLFLLFIKQKQAIELGLAK